MRKSVFSFFIAILIIFSLSTKVLAQNNSNAWFISPESITNAGQNASLENLTVANFSAMMSNVVVAAGGNGTSGGATSYLHNMVLAMMARPGGAATQEYLADMGHSLGIVPKEAFAQGTGFTSLTPILAIWKIMRDFVYVVYVVVFFAVGFMILLRKKIDPRTVITIEAALPKLIISLILITFSYAIVAFMIDLSNIVSRIIGAFFVGRVILENVPGKTTTDLLNEIFSSNIFQLARPIGNVGALASAAGAVFDTGGLTGDAAHFLAWLSTEVIFTLALLFATFRIFFGLLGPYVSIVLNIIFAPFTLLFGALPGGEASVGSWLKSVFAKIAVFPVAFFMILLAATFGAQDKAICALPNACFDWFQHGTNIQASLKTNLQLAMPPFGNWSAVVGDLIAFGILFTIPSVTKLVENALKVKDQGGDFATQTIMKGMSKVPILKGVVS